MKFCKDCTHYKYLGKSFCTREEFSTTYNLVSGAELKIGLLSCTEERYNGACGELGEFFVRVKPYGRD